MAHRSALLRLGLLVALGCTACASQPRESVESATATPAPSPLDPREVAALDSVYDRVHSLLLIEVVRPRQADLDADDVRELTFRLRVGLTLVGRISTHHDHHYQVARTLGALYATGTSLGWPAAPFIAERFLQRAVEIDELDPSGWESLGLLHMLTGDLSGAIHYLETARSLARVPSPSVQIALGQAYYLDGRRADAVEALSLLVDRMPDAELPRAMLELVESEGGEPTTVFRTPTNVTPEPFRSARTVSALAWPDVQYQNLAHGFVLRIPWDWILFEETLDRPLDACTRIADVAFDLPLDELGADPPQTRVRVTALPIPDGTDARSLATMREPIFVYPEAVEELSPVVTGTVHQRYVDPEAGRLGRAGEVVFAVHREMGFILHLSSTPDEIDGAKPAFDEFLRGFGTRDAGAWQPDGCGGDRPM